MSETVLHILRDCKKETEVWLLLLPSSFCSCFFSFEKTKTWMTWNLRTKFNVNGVSWQIMFPLVCHQLWLARNKRVFDGEDSNYQVLIVKVRACIAWGGECISRSLTKGRREGVWKAPEKGFVKLNVDGACKFIRGGAACAGVLRDGERRFSF